MLGLSPRTPKSEPNAPQLPVKSGLMAGFEAALGFPTSRALTLQPSRQALAEKAGEEASFGRIIVDEQGLTAGTRLHVLEPARALLADWREARRAFDVAIEPQRADIEALRRLDGTVAALSVRRDENLAQAEAEFAQDQKFAEVKDQFEKSGARFTSLQLRHGNRSANMMAHNPLYWLALLCLGAAEWLINYDIFFLFTSVAAIAAGATIAMGVLLAFAAHAHGLLLKQAAYRFGQHRHVGDRWSSWRLLALSTFSLAVVLAAAGGSRYAVVAHQAAAASGPNILGEAASLTFDPVRDVLLSLLWNVMAWAAGVFLSWFAHDDDPEYMDATAQWRRASRGYHRYRRPQVDRLRTIEAQHAREKEAAATAAASRSAGVEAERKLLEKVEAHETALVNAVAGAVRNAAQVYHECLAQIAASGRGALAIEQADGSPLSAAEFRAQPVRIDAALVRGLMG